jgi:hypothetical protein
MNFHHYSTHDVLDVAKTSKCLFVRKRKMKKPISITYDKWQKITSKKNLKNWKEAAKNVSDIYEES